MQICASKKWGGETTLRKRCLFPTTSFCTAGETHLSVTGRASGSIRAVIRYTRMASAERARAMAPARGHRAGPEGTCQEGKPRPPLPHKHVAHHRTLECLPVVLVSAYCDACCAKQLCCGPCCLLQECRSIPCTTLGINLIKLLNVKLIKFIKNKY